MRLYSRSKVPPFFSYHGTFHPAVCFQIFAEKRRHRPAVNFHEPFFLILLPNRASLPSSTDPYTYIVCTKFKQYAVGVSIVRYCTDGHLGSLWMIPASRPAMLVFLSAPLAKLISTGPPPHQAALLPVKTGRRIDSYERSADVFYATLRKVWCGWR